MTVRVEVYQRADNKLLSAKTHETDNVEQVLTYWRENCDGVNLYLLLSVIEDGEVVKQYCSDRKFLPKKRSIPRSKGFDLENKRAVFSLEEITEAGYERVIFNLGEGEFFVMSPRGTVLFTSGQYEDAVKFVEQSKVYDRKSFVYIVDRDSYTYGTKGDRYALFRRKENCMIHLKVSGKGYKVV